MKTNQYVCNTEKQGEEPLIAQQMRFDSPPTSNESNGKHTSTPESGKNALQRKTAQNSNPLHGDGVDEEPLEAPHLF